MRAPGRGGQHAVQGEEDGVQGVTEAGGRAACPSLDGRVQMLHLPVPWEHADEGIVLAFFRSKHAGWILWLNVSYTTNQYLLSTLDGNIRNF